MSIKINKLIEKKHLGYRCITPDQVMFETSNERGTLVVDNMEHEIRIDLTAHNIELLSEFIRYIKSDMEENK